MSDQSPPRQSPRSRVSESEEISGGNALSNSASSDLYFTDIDDELRDVISGLRHLGPAEIEDLLSVPVPGTSWVTSMERLNSKGEPIHPYPERDRNGNLIWLRSNGERR